MVLFAGFRVPYLDKDYGVYKFLWQLKSVKEYAEISFVVIKYTVKDLLKLKFSALLLLYAFIGVGVKIYGIRKISPFVFSSLLLYFSHYFLLHEMTQIRIGVATGFMLIAVYYLMKKDYYAYYSLALCAVCFHYSASLCLLFPLLKNDSKTIKVYALLVPIGYVLFFFSTYLDISIPIPFVGDKVEVYKEATKSGFLKDSEINVFNVLFLIRISIWYLMFYFRERISEHYNGFYLLLKIYALSLFSFLFLANIPVFAFRVQELLGVVELILIPLIIYLFNEKYSKLGRFAVFLLASVFFVFDLYFNKLLDMDKLW